MKNHPIIPVTDRQTLFDDANFHDLPHGMLPIADKPLVAYLIESLAEQGYSSISIATSHATQEQAKTLGSGDFWGVSLQLINCDQDQDVDIHLNELENNDITTVTIIPCHSMEDVMAAEQVTTLPSLAITETDQIYQQLKQSSWQQTYSLDDYFQDNLSALNDHKHFLLDGFELKKNLFINSGSQYPRTSITQRDGVIYIGEQAHLQKSCDLSGDTVVGRGSVIDDQVILNKTVILPNTYVGKNMNLSNCIVGSSWIYNTMTKGFITVEDPALLSTC